MIRPLFIAIVLVASLFACGNYQSKTTDLEIDLKADGPFFAGANSLIGEVQFNAASALGVDDFSEISNVTISKITVELEEESSFTLDQFGSATLQLVSDNSPMTSIAVMNPIVVKDDEINLTVSKEAEVTSFFKDGTFSVLLDLDFLEDSYEDYINAEVEINLTVEYK
jgi:hypothetical protein